MRRGAIPAGVLVVAGLLLGGCGDEEPAPPETTTTVAPATGAEIDPADAYAAANRAVDLLGDHAPSVVWVMFSGGASAADVIAAIGDGSIAGEPGAEASSVRLASLHRVSHEPDSETFQRFREALGIGADEYGNIVFAQLILFGRGYSKEQIAAAVDSGALAATEGDRFSCLWSQYIPGFPEGTGLTIAGVEPAGPSEFGDDPCGVGDTEPATDDDAPDSDPAGIVIGPPASGVQAEFDCTGLEPPAGIELEPRPESSRATEGDTGELLDIICNYTASDGEGAVGGLAVTIRYFCADEARNTYAGLADVSGRSPVSGVPDAVRELETVEPGEPLIESNSGSFDSQEKVFALLADYTVATIVLNANQGDFDAAVFLDLARQLAARMHPSLEALDYC